MKLNTLSTSSQELLKYVALFLMTTDHAGAILFGNYEGVHLSTILGRLVFPIFAYLAIYNYLYHTKNKKRYIKRLFIFAFASQVPYFFAFYEVQGRFTLNVLFTLGFGLWYVYLMEEYVSKTERLLDMFMYGFILSFVFAIIIGAWGDFSIMGILTMIGFYLFLKNPNVVTLLSLRTVMFPLPGIIRINTLGLSDEEIIQRISKEALVISDIEIDKNLPLKEVLSELRRKNIAVALQTSSLDDYKRR